MAAGNPAVVKKRLNMGQDFYEGCHTEENKKTDSVSLGKISSGSISSDKFASGTADKNNSL